MRRALRLAFRGTLFLLLFCVLAALGGYAYLSQSLPKSSGEIATAGARAPVEILRDGHGIPHVFAASVVDAHFGLGFAHAQDRLWQMEMNRRVAAGRLAEALGAGALDTDRFLRTLGVRRAAEENLKRYDSETRAALDAYAAGVNAFLATDPVLPIEFWLTGVRPEPWAPADSIAWAKMMAWDLGGNWRSELLRMRLSSTLPTQRIEEFLAPYPGDAPAGLPDLRELYRKLEKPSRELARTFGEAPDFALGSNSWTVAGSLSASGKPLLANDPHLGLTAPPVWYFAHLHAPGLDVIGATLPGAPGVVLGRNERIAWGFTNTGPDVQDLYIEKLDGAGRYVAPEGPRAFLTREETIRVKGAPDERITVRVSRHGPVISDTLRVAQEAVPRGHAVSMAWTALADDDLTAQGILRLGTARDWEGFLAAARDFHAPQQNMTYADVDGNIGFVAAGRVPVRKAANDLKGLAPAPGWDARYDWAGYVPFGELPKSFNPAAGLLVTANHKITPPGYPHPLTFEWQPPYRARRIETLLRETAKHSLGSFAAMQADILSLPSQELLRSLLRITAPKSDAAREALKQLGAWDARMDAGRPEPLLFVAWWRELARRVYADELGDAFQRNWSARPVFMQSVLDGRGGQGLWCDDVRTPRGETCEQAAAEALDAAIADLRARYGTESATWQWGAAHVARHEHRPFGRVRWLAPFFDIRVPTPGDAFTVNVGRSDFDQPEPFANRHAASLRALYDLAEPDASLFIHSGGQSGNVLSAHYRSFTAAWARGQYVPMVTARQRLEAAGVQRLVLAPRR